MKKSNRHRPAKVILLKDLAPGEPVRGGSGKRAFGESAAGNEAAKQPEPRKMGRKRPTRS